jgi:uncharacterized protein YkwD
VLPLAVALWVAHGVRDAAVARTPPLVPRAPHVCAGATLHPTRANTTAVNAATLCLVNRVRTGHRLRPLRPNGDLQRVASKRVRSMVHADYFADVSPSGQTPQGLVGATAYAAHATALTIGEDIGWGTGADSSPAQMVLAWMRSPPHRAIILASEFAEAGVDVAAAVPSVLSVSPPGATYAIEFGARQP